MPPFSSCLLVSASAAILAAVVVRSAWWLGLGRVRVRVRVRVRDRVVNGTYLFEVVQGLV